MIHRIRSLLGADLSLTPEQAGLRGFPPLPHWLAALIGLLCLALALASALFPAASLRWLTVALAALALAALLDRIAAGARLLGAQARLREELEQRNRAEAELRAHHEFLNSVYEGAATPIFVIEAGDDGEFRFIGANTAYEQATGFVRDTICGKRIEEVFPPDRAAHARAVYERCVRYGLPHAEEQHVPWSSVGPWWLRVITPLRDTSSKSGKVTRLVGTGINISELRATDEALRESEARYRLITDHSSDLICLLDEEARYVYASPSYQVLGYNPDALIGTLSQNYLHPGDLTHLMENIAPLGQGEQVQVIYRFRHADGSWRWLDSHISVAAWRGTNHLIIVSRDITDRKAAEAALRESEARYRLIAENTGDLIALLDGRTHFVYASPSFTTTLGFDTSALLDTPALDLVHPDDISDVAMLWERVGEGDLPPAVFRCRDAQGAWRWFEVQRTMVTWQGERYALIVGRDITERRRLEAQLLQAHKMEGIGRLAGGIAHDFNNLLVAIGGYAELARAELPPDHAVQRDLRDIMAASERAAALTRQLLAFARRQIFSPQPLNLDDLIQSLDRLLRRLIPENIELVIIPTPGLGLVQADADQIGQVLINLVANARDAMPTGGRITIETGNVTLDADALPGYTALQPGSYVLVAVSDIGVGMDEQTLRHVFEPFFTTKELGHGTGLGLAMCYGIVKQHGGSIWAYSEVGKGSTFKIYLPQTQSSAAKLAPPQDAAVPRGGNETVLLVEDSEAVRVLVARVLRSAGYTVIEAPNGSAALQRAAEAGREISLLLTDVIMPEMGGEELAAKLTQAQPALKVLFMSGYTDSGVLRRGDSMRAELLQKPFTAAMLIRRVRDMLDA